MSDSTSATNGQEPGAQPQAGTIHPESTSQAQAAAGTSETSTTVDVAVLQRELAEARREAAKHRTDLRKVTDAQLSETERLQRRVTELEQEREAIASRDRERAIRLAALEAGAGHTVPRARWNATSATGSPPGTGTHGPWCG